MTRPLSLRMRRQFEAAGCVFREEVLDRASGVTWENGYSRDGGYIAPTTSGDHYRWLARFGIFDPQRARAGHHAANIGKVTRGALAGKWLGWSHRASCAFSVGDMMFDPDLLDPSHPEYAKWSRMPFAAIGTVRIATDAGAREAAARFAEYMS